ncbi:aminoglycoside phosphotransferase family protein [Rhodococcus sp. JVH1]|uniref:aminoglycoside phosphotransferase family protein n=1 Tax=Rhodococcus sp. JVH1 TaxID=745408 RepID=UPI0002EB5BA6|nr:aminoglycoside phosphotransferase family protein [Rhodococcus sp. JVH1]
MPDLELPTNLVREMAEYDAPDAPRRTWLVIDPKPYVGDPTYDVLQHMLDHVDRLAADPVGFASRMAGLLGLDRERLRLWLFARCVEGSIDQPRLWHIAAMLHL